MAMILRHMITIRIDIAEKESHKVLINLSANPQLANTVSNDK